MAMPGQVWWPPAGQAAERSKHPSARAAIPDEMLVGTGGNDTINVGDGDDFIFSGDGNDILIAAAICRT